MDFTVSELNLPGTDGIHTLRGKIYVPNGEIKGVFQLVHGMTEYIGRYDRFMSAIAESGYVCFGTDNLGHGNTADNDAELGFIAGKDGYKYLVDDVYAAYREVRKSYPEGKYILMGHSMGSFIARLVAEKYGEELKGLIICGTAGPQPLAPVGLAITAIMRKAYGERHYSDLLEKLLFGAYNRGLEGLSKYDWLTKDRAVIEAYEQDRFCTFRFTVSAMSDLLWLTALCNRTGWYSKISTDLPVLLISGKDDPVGGKGAGVKRVFKGLRKSGIKDVNMYLYENCRHEILNDSCKDEVTDDVLDFIG